MRSYPLHPNPHEISQKESIKISVDKLLFLKLLISYFSQVFQYLSTKFLSYHVNKILKKRQVIELSDGTFLKI